MTFRRLRVLVDHLPPESASKTAIRDAMPEHEFLKLIEDRADIEPGHGPWGRTDQLLAVVADRLDWVVYAIYHAQTGKPGDQPKPIPRPGVPTEAGLAALDADRAEADMDVLLAWRQETHEAQRRQLESGG